MGCKGADNDMSDEREQALAAVLCGELHIGGVLAGRYVSIRTMGDSRRESGGRGVGSADGWRNARREGETAR